MNINDKQIEKENADRDVQVTADTFRSIIRLVLTHVWDPIRTRYYGAILEEHMNQSDDDDFIAVPAFPPEGKRAALFMMEDEYEAYIPAIEEMVMRKANADEIYGYLLMVETVFMKVDRDSSVRREAAERLSRLAEGSKLLRND